jgi:TolB-like protein
MGASVVASVETASPSTASPFTASAAGTACPALNLRLLGPMTAWRDGAEQCLPASRKVRGLIAYLALAPRPVTRSHLCELLGDVPNDPRGELRWCLSKARAVVDSVANQRIRSIDDTVRLDLDGSFVDVAEIGRAMQVGIDGLDLTRLQALEELFVGDFLEGMETERSPQFNGWLLAQRRRLRGYHIAVLEHLVGSGESAQIADFAHLERWLALAPFDRRAHASMLQALARCGQRHEGDEHVEATARRFEAEGLDWRPVRDAWVQAKASQRAVGAGPAADVIAARVVVPAEPAAAARRASIAIMPFVDQAVGETVRGGLADGLTHDIITRLAKLRSLFVIAQGTVFALDARRMSAEEAGRTLDVDYVVAGLVRRQGSRLFVNVELAEARTARVVWAELFDQTRDDAFALLDEIGDRIVASIASEIEATERNRAILRPPNSLDAWEAHHRGLWHMYRFDRDDNARAAHFFKVAVRLDPTFARAHAGLSFTHFQNAFQHWADPAHETERAFAAAADSLLADERDPAAHWAMGRALWLRDEQDTSLRELETAVGLSPNFALGHYTLAFIHSQSGDPEAAIDSADQSRRLSPFDPLLFGILGSRAMALARLGRHDEAAGCAVEAASRPNAHVHIRAIAANCLSLAGRLDEGRAFAARIHAAVPGYRFDDFAATFRFEPEARALFREGARRIGLA